MKVYIGAKIVEAEPMDLKTFRYQFYKDNPVNNEPGYHVVYPNPGGKLHHSWSPKKVFEEAYRELNPGEFEFVQES